MGFYVLDRFYVRVLGSIWASRAIGLIILLDLASLDLECFANFLDKVL